MPELAGLPLTTPEDILAVISARASRLHTLKAVAKIKLFSPEVKLSFKEAVVAQKPASLRLEALGLFSQTVHLILSNGRDLAVYSAQENRLYLGEVSRENLTRFLPLGLDDAELMSILFAESPWLTQTQPSLIYRENEGNYAVFLDSPGGELREIVWLSPQGGLLLKREVYHPTLGVVLQVEMSRFERVKEFIFPRRIKVNLPLRELSIEINYRELELNADVDGGLFSFPFPFDGEVVFLDEYS